MPGFFPVPVVPRPERTALVLAGGGSNGAYEVGVLRALGSGRSPATRYRPLEADTLIGASVGAYNATFLASRPEASMQRSIQHLEQIWRDRIPESPDRWGNGVYRIRADPFEIFQPALFLQHPRSVCEHLTGDFVHLARHAFRIAPELLRPGVPVGRRLLESLDFSAFVDLSPLEQLAHDTIDLGGLSRSHKELAIAATGWCPSRSSSEFGRDHGPPPLTRLFSKAELAGSYGIRPILASTAMPGIFPPVEIDGQLYVDGGVAMNIPLAPAVISNRHVLHLVYPSLDTTTPNSQLQLPSVEAMLRELLMGWQATLTAQLGNVESWRDIRRRLRTRDELKQIKQFLLRTPIQLEGREPSDLVRLARRPNIEVHLFAAAQSSDDSVGWLDFSRPRITRLLEQGFNDALHHNCRTAGCLLPRSIGPSNARENPRPTLGVMGGSG